MYPKLSYDVHYFVDFFGLVLGIDTLHGVCDAGVEMIFDTISSTPRSAAATALVWVNMSTQ